jgi:phage terminase large subunit-like protein
MQKFSKRINNSHILFAILDLDSSEIYRQYYRRKTQTDALITVLAVLRYKNDTGQFPDSLSSLVAAGYLRSVPKDPYSGNALIYHLTDNGFKLYSVGEDFKDNGGCIDTSRVSMKELSLHIHSPDIVYWPVELIEGNPPDFGMGMPMVGF